MRVVTTIGALAMTSAMVTACPSKEIETVFDPCDPVVLVFDEDDHDLRASTESAVEMWRAVTPHTQLTTKPTEGAAEIPVKQDDAGAAFHGFYDDEQGIVWINDGLDDAERAITIAHEVGHAFGLHHVDEHERRSVMNKGNLVRRPNDEDGDALADLWGRCARAAAECRRSGRPAPPVGCVRTRSPASHPPPSC
jgi:hypothetical protein